MTTYEEAVAKILDNIATLQAEERPLHLCLGQVAAENIRSSISLPQQATSGPDGYALRAADIATASKEHPVTLKIGETVHAGSLPRQKVQPETAARIMTGSVVPKGANCVVRFEDTDEPDGKNGPRQNCPMEVKIYVSPAAGTNISAAGHIVQKGTLVVPKGTVIGPSQISALTTIGKTKIKVFRRPVIAVISTGDELMAAGSPLKPGKSYNCNTPALIALIRHHGGIPKAVGIARDNRASLERKFTRALALSADAIITSGGVSKGDFDLVRLTVGNLGKVLFNRIMMGPGAAFTFGLLSRDSGKHKQTVPVFALSGPPTGCLINFETLVRPALRKMMGYTVIHHPKVEAKAVDAVAPRKPLSAPKKSSGSSKAPSPLPVASFNFVRWTNLTHTEAGFLAKFNSADGMGFLPTMATANALTILPVGASVKPGDKVQVLPLDWVE
jgi:molybdopterin molybdotransferase